MDIIPKYSECSAKENQKLPLTALEQFILDYEPACDGEIPWREKLTAVVKEFGSVWRCFHCGEVITHPTDAKNHFGRNEGSEPVCRIKAAGEFALLQALRNAEETIDRYRMEDSDILRAMSSMQADHIQALRRQEELGYSRGLSDTRKEMGHGG